jgi:hypothetical protein
VLKQQAMCCYVFNKEIRVLFFARGSIKCMFWIARVAQLSLHRFAHL